VSPSKRQQLKSWALQDAAKA